MQPARLRFTLAMRDEIIGRALEGDSRLCPLHPGIERIMQEEIRKDRADTTPLRDPLSPLDEGAILALHGGLEPPCHIQEDPWTGRVLAERPQQQRMINVVKGSCILMPPSSTHATREVDPRGGPLMCSARAAQPVV